MPQTQRAGALAVFRVVSTGGGEEDEAIMSAPQVAQDDPACTTRLVVDKEALQGAPRLVASASLARAHSDDRPLAGLIASVGKHPGCPPAQFAPQAR